MAQRKETDPESGSKRRPAATTPQAREHQLVAMAYDAAEKQMLAGTASAQVISHFLKMGSSREMIEQERLRMEVELQAAKIEQLASEVRVEALYAEAIQAMREYSGQEQESDDLFDD